MTIEEAIAIVKEWEAMKREPDEDYQTEALEILYKEARLAQEYKKALESLKREGNFIEARKAMYEALKDGDS